MVPNIYTFSYQFSIVPRKAFVFSFLLCVCVCLCGGGLPSFRFCAILCDAGRSMK